jgi:hypothetical protein
LRSKITRRLFPQKHCWFACFVFLFLLLVYAVGTYLDPLAMSAVKHSSPTTIQAALLNPTYPRTIRIVMARDLSVDKFTAALQEALEPRMQGQDLQTYV